MKKIKYLKSVSLPFLFLTLTISSSVWAEFDYDMYFRNQEAVKLADNKVLSMVPEEERTILLSKDFKQEEYKKLGKKYREKCDNESDAISCYLYSRMTSDREKKVNYMSKSCSTGTLDVACLADDIYLNARGMSIGPEVDYGYCTSGYNLNYCSIFFNEAFKDGLRDISSYTLPALLEKTEFISPYELVLKINTEKMDDTTFEQLEGFRSQLNELPELLEEQKKEPWYKSVIEHGDGSTYALHSLYNLAAFIDIVLDGAESAMPTLRAGCNLYLNKDTLTVSEPQCSSYLAGIKNESYKKTSEDFNVLKNHCILTADQYRISDTCDIVLKNMEKKEADSLKLELCKINKNGFPDCSELLDGF